MRSLALGLAVFALGLLASALVTSPRAGAHLATGSLSASVGPGFTIGMSASTVAPGAYTITVDDKSSLHNFHLTGPGVNESTSISGTGSTSWSVTLSAGTYHFQCDAHASTMNGDLTAAGTTTTTATTTTTVHTTTAHTTTRETTAETTTEAATTTAPATTTEPAAPPPAPVTARIAATHATRAVVSVTVASSAAGRAVADLYAGSRRLAHAAGPVPGTLRLRPAHPLKPGRYVVKLRVTARGATIASQRTVRVG